ncbi:hypothetical protein TWF730_009806 [Orbilia blumenaviensis]|uniref:WSC domain-containing protein n=1 Tax=Orbilia blumenaviensis TaxID=1796055 RepID=A0AAV9UVZ5_9PEZI
MRFLVEGAAAALALATTVTAGPMVNEPQITHRRGLQIQKRLYNGWNDPYSCWCNQTCRSPFRDWKTVGCFEQMGGGAQLMHYKSFDVAPDRMTKKACWAICKGQGTRYAAIGGNGKGCACGNVVNARGAQADKCKATCTGDKSTKDCGGDGAFYTVFKDPSYKDHGSNINSYNNGWAHKGCFWDDRDRIIRYESLVSDKMTLERCKSVCTSQGYPYLALHADAKEPRGKRCLCGGTMRNGARIADPSDCNIPCAGNSKESCGGRWAVNVYYNEALDNKERCGIPISKDGAHEVVKNNGKTTLVKRGKPAGDDDDEEEKKEEKEDEEGKEEKDDEKDDEKKEEEDDGEEEEEKEEPKKTTATLTVTVTRVVDKNKQQITKIGPRYPAYEDNSLTTVVFKTKTVTSVSQPPKRTTAVTLTRVIIIKTEGGRPIKTTLIVPKTGRPNPAIATVTKTIVSTSTQAPGGKPAKPTKKEEEPEEKPEEKSEEKPEEKKDEDKPEEEEPKLPDTLCVMPGVPQPVAKQYKGAKYPLGGIKAPAVSCHNDKAKHKAGYHFKLFVGKGTDWPDAVCRIDYAHRASEVTAACWNACIEQRKSCYTGYAQDEPAKKKECDFQQLACLDVNDYKKNLADIGAIDAKYCFKPGPPYPVITKPLTEDPPHNEGYQ